ncbi:MAG: acetate--CoA ligase family protein, partial [Actinomycetota bacterium]|nr:acetate--CoA ligase family protein [Actinomycetota bacterium]
MPVTGSIDKTAVREVLDKVKAEGREALTAPEGKRIADAYGIPSPREGLATTADEAATLAEDIGGPVACKIVSPDILHKTEAGGVLVGIEGAAAARDAFDKIVASAKAYDGSATITGVQVQQMLGGGQEVIIGATTDP